MSAADRSNAALADDFLDCIELLNAHHVTYILVGGYAVGWHGVIRATGDIDFFFEQTAESGVIRCRQAGKGFGENARSPDALLDNTPPDALTSGFYSFPCLVVM